jgi:ribose 5-phosphate isomerase A
MATTPAEIEGQKQAAAEAAALLVQDGQKIGLGTGSTVAYLLPALAARGLREMRWVATSPRTEEAARALGLEVEPFELAGLDIAIDGADQVTPDNWLVKGGGGAHTRERIVAATARRFVVISSANKVVERLQPPVPLELHAFGLASTLERLAPLGEVRLRDVPRSPDGGVIADLHGPIAEPAALAARLDATPGVVDHGLFPPAMVHDVLIAGPDGVAHRRA